MRILWLALLCTAAGRAQGYGDYWPDHAFPQLPSSPRPIYVVTNIINELGVRILREYGDTGNVGNVAFSPTGIGFVLAALYEGSAGPGNEQIAHVLGLPRDRDITRIGLRDIHRRLRSYLSPDGFLGGLTLNRENTKLKREYEEILKFLGFDFPPEDDESNATRSTTSLPEYNSSLTSTEAAEASTISIAFTEKSTSTVTPVINNGETSTTQIPEEGSHSSMNPSNEAITTNGYIDETTTLKRDGDVDNATTVTAGAQVIPELTESIKVVEVTEAVSTTQDNTVSSITPDPTTAPLLTMGSGVASNLTEAPSKILAGGVTAMSLISALTTTVHTLLAVPTTVTDSPELEGGPLSTASSTEGAMVTVRAEITTVEPNEPLSVTFSENTTIVQVTESSTTTESSSTIDSNDEKPVDEFVDESESESDMGPSFPNPVGSQDELATTTETSFTLAPEVVTVSNEILSDSTTIGTGTTIADGIDEAVTIADLGLMGTESGNLISLGNQNMGAEISTTFSSIGTDIFSERRRVRRIGIRDPVVSSLMKAISANSRGEVAAGLDSNNSRESQVVWVNKVAKYSFAERNADDGATLRHRIILRENVKADPVVSERTTKRGRRNRGPRRARGYLPNTPAYPDSGGYPEETSWPRKHGGWRVHSPKAGGSSRDSTELTFLVNGEDATVVPAATYTVVLPFAYLPNVQALALEFPLDDPRYNILLLLPTDSDGTRRLAKDLGSVTLTEIRKELQPAWVRAIIPSFMLKGFVTLTPFLQRLGIRDVFEPRAADLSPMTDDMGVYARDVQQSIGVNIRNYMKPDRTHSRNGILERAGPVSFIAEHPFLFFIIDAETGVSLIAGRIEDPLNSRIL